MIAVGLGLLVAVPVVAATQPFVPGGPLVILLVVLGLVVIARRSLRDFEGHVRAGSEVILELMAQPDAGEVPAPRPTLDAVEAVLPGFGGLASITVGAGSPAIGRSLAELDLRARTGASVLAIARGTRGLAMPEPTLPLQVGDVLALAGSAEAVLAARAVLEAAASS